MIFEDPFLVQDFACHCCSYRLEKEDQCYEVDNGPDVVHPFYIGRYYVILSS